MLMKSKILETFKNSDLFNRFFKVRLFAKQTTNVVQFHSGGDDYNPPANVEGLAGTIGNTANNGVAFAWRDCVERTAAPGEKRLYATDAAGQNVIAMLHLKNDGTIILNGSTLQLEFENVVSSGAWQHTGTMSITGDTDIAGNLSANHIEAADGKDGVLDKPKFEKGIATGGT